MSRPKSIRIESDGTVMGTRVFDEVSGVELQNICGIEIGPIDSMARTQILTAKVEFVFPKIELKGVEMSEEPTHEELLARVRYLEAELAKLPVEFEPEEDWERPDY